jgi:hypothetical protein
VQKCRRKKAEKNLPEIKIQLLIVEKTSLSISEVFKNIFSPNF